MKSTINILCFLSLCLLLSSCMSKKKVTAMKMDYEKQLEVANKDLAKCGQDLNGYMSKLSTCEQARATAENTAKLRDEQMADLRAQLADAKKVRDQQLSQVGDLTVLSQSANDNIKETLGQLEKKDKYIQLLQAAKTKADSINLALAVNLKGVLKDGIEDEDVEIKVDKTVVFVNLSDKMLFQSGSYNLTSKASDVLGKIAQIIKSRPGIEVLVEGYTDNVPIKNSCIDDNWDLSVKRSTSVVRVLKDSYGVDPNKLIAAGRGEYNKLASNDTAEGRSMNRRTRIIIMPKLNQFYDLLNPSNVPQ
ncbi:MAG: flagellar motor protein MotB [Saprospiraceae bacterium]